MLLLALIYIQSISMKGGAREGAGRKKGSGQAAHYRAMLEPHAEGLIQQVVDLAKGGVNAGANPQVFAAEYTGLL